MLTSLQAGPYTVRGVSVGGVYTSIQVPELDLLFDVGIAPRSVASSADLLISHAHADHIGALPTLLGIRGLMRHGPLRIFLPEEIVAETRHALDAMSRLQRYELAVELVGMAPDAEHLLRGDLWVKAFRTTHPVPSLGYLVMRRVNKLRPELLDLPGEEIRRRREAGDADTFYVDERLELAYVTDTLATVIDEVPAITRAKVLVLECSFLDDRKSREASRAGCHIHLDDLIPRAECFHNEHVVLMHFSQIYRPDEVREILDERCPEVLRRRVIPFAAGRHWPG